jgi:cytochrome c oxidase cbb3-type subunit 3
VPDLADAEWLYGTGGTSEVEQTILYGIRSGHHRARNFADMPAFATQTPYRRYAIESLAPGEIDDVIQYLFAAQHRPADRAAATRGYGLFNAKGQCADCHTNDLRGDNYIGAPDLLDSKRLYGDGSAASLYETIAYGRAGVCPAWTGRLSALQIRALAVYIHGLAHAPG